MTRPLRRMIVSLERPGSGARPFGRFRLRSAHSRCELSDRNATLSRPSGACRACSECPKLKVNRALRLRTEADIAERRVSGARRSAVVDPLLTFATLRQNLPIPEKDGEPGLFGLVVGGQSGLGSRLH